MAQGFFHGDERPVDARKIDKIQSGGELKRGVDAGQLVRAAAGRHHRPGFRARSDLGGRRHVGRAGAPERAVALSRRGRVVPARPFVVPVRRGPEGVAVKAHRGLPRVGSAQERVDHDRARQRRLDRFLHAARGDGVDRQSGFANLDARRRDHSGFAVRRRIRRPHGPRSPHVLASFQQARSIEEFVEHALQRPAPALEPPGVHEHQRVVAPVGKRDAPVPLRGPSLDGRVSRYVGSRPIRVQGQGSRTHRNPAAGKGA